MSEIVPSGKQGKQRQLVRYSPELMAVICDRLSRGESLRAICKDEGMPGEAAVRYWVSQDHEGCAAGFEAARAVQVSGAAKYRDMPDKNDYSHVAESLQYLLVGGGEARLLVQRTQRGVRPELAVMD